MPADRKGLGAWGEALARRRLAALGWELLAANYRCRWGEVDLVATHGGQYIFIEVKTRRTGSPYGRPEESITAAKARRLVATAESFLEERGHPGAHWRIDLITVELDKRGRLLPLRHVENAVERAADA